MLGDGVADQCRAAEVTAVGGDLRLDQKLTAGRRVLALDQLVIVEIGGGPILHHVQEAHHLVDVGLCDLDRHGCLPGCGSALFEKAADRVAREAHASVRIVATAIDPEVGEFHGARDIGGDHEIKLDRDSGSCAARSTAPR